MHRQRKRKAEIPERITSIRDAINVVMLNHGITIEGLASAADVSSSDLNRYLNNQKGTTAKSLEKLFAAFAPQQRSELMDLLKELIPPPKVSGVGCIVCLDDEQLTVEMLASRLRIETIQVTTISEAQEVLASNKSVRALVLDICLGEPSTGLDFAAQVRRQYPNLPIVVYSAFAYERNYIRRAAGLRLDGWLEKTPGDTKELVERCLPNLIGIGVRAGAESESEARTPIEVAN